MSQTDLTYIALIVDRSGSMESIRADMDGGINQFIKDQANEPGKCMVTLAQFDTDYELVYDYKDISQVQPYSLVPRGGTALLDAIGNTIRRMDERIASIPAEHQPEAVIVVIVTDGEENSSKEWKLDQVKDLITEHTNVDNWQFIYLGANQDAISVGTSMGIPINSSMTFAAASSGIGNTYASLSHNTSSYRSVVSTAGGAAGADLSFSAADRLEALEEDDNSWTSTPKPKLDKKRLSKV